MLIAVVAALFLTLSGAFGTGGVPFVPRLTYWLVLMPLGTVFAWALGMAAARTPPLAERPLAQTVFMSLGMGLIFTGLVWVLAPVLSGSKVRQDVTDYLVPVMLLSFAMGVLNLLAARRPSETHAGPAGAAPARFLERLPPRLRGASLHAVEAEDHYLRLHTDRGSELILFRLSDAVAELDGLEGARTHRSWWVAKDAVAGARRDGDRMVLQLKSGAEAPVSRTYVRALRSEGWF